MPTPCMTSLLLLQIQEELDLLAQQATTNAMYIIKSEKHVFTNNAGYMKLLNKMNAFVMRRRDGSNDPEADARDAADEVQLMLA